MPTLATIGPAVIHAGQSLSDAVNCSGAAGIVRVILPNQWNNAVERLSS
jgi:hypothetical protein